MLILWQKTPNSNNINLVNTVPYRHITLPPPGQRQNGPEIIDRAIICAVEDITCQEANFWNQPQEYDRRGAGHRFFQYPAMMLPVVQRKIIQIIKEAAPTTRTLLDPFMGSGTALAAGMLNGLDCYGQDINPMSILLSKVKVQAFDEPMLKKAKRALWKRVKTDKSLELTTNFPKLTKWFKTSVAQELSKLVRAIRQEPCQTTRQFFWVTLAETVRLTSNDRTSTFKLHARPSVEITLRNHSPLKVFAQLLTQNIDDIALYSEQLRKQGYLRNRMYTGRVSISVLDSSQLINIPFTQPQPATELNFNFEQGFDLIVSSPPYGDNRTTVPYGQHAYLPLQWIDFSDIDPVVSPSLLSTTHEIDNKSLGGQRNTVTDDDLTLLSGLSPAFKANIDALTKLKPLEVKKVICFVRDLNAVLVRCAKVVKPNGYLVWTIGNRKVGGLEIHNNVILEELLRHCDVIPVYRIERSIQRKRMAARNKSTTTMSKEEILIFRKI